MEYKFRQHLEVLDFKKCALEQAIYTKASKDLLLLVGVYVDNLIITGTPTQTKGDISIKQSAYANKILKEAGMLESNETVIPMDPGSTLTKKTEGTLVNSIEYRSLIGCLIYLLHTRPDLSYSVGLLSLFMQEPKEQHMKAIKQVLHYVKGTKDYGITYKHKGENKIQGLSDSSYGVNTQEGKGTTGIIFYYGDSPISWSTQKQAIVALSSCESEFIAATAAATQALWLKRLLSRLTHTEEEKITIMVDNKSAIALMKNPVFHRRIKHVDTKYHFIRECVERDDIQVEFVSEEHQKADILTKALPKIKFLVMRQLIGLKDLRHIVCN
nr:ribonuclease H-like domain, reverse transcriptase, RNA-dependent DNA polymerase [Tanacetum cinerariifolium]